MNELTDFQKQYFEDLKAEEQEELSNNAEIISSFKEDMKVQGIILTDKHFRFIRTTGILACYPNIVSYLHPTLVNDKEGLMNFKNLCQTFERKPFFNGYLQGDKFMLLANKYFRRGFNELNNYAPRFIEMFWNFNNPQIDCFISLDTDRVRINLDNSSYAEFDTWYGAKFNKDIETIKDGLVKIVPPQDISHSDISFFFGNAYCLDIKWSSKNDIKSFQAEEFKNDEVKLSINGVTYFPARYVHAEYDLKARCFRHFDGAIHFYTETEYHSRRNSDFDYNTKNQNHIKTMSQKLFKMNGSISVETWIEFTSHFLTGNPLVFEYFEGRYPKRIEEILDIRRMK
ncbi:hypothetical protein JMG10_07820 [Nostoc ellipsosporum NOK]|nr:hypothetical protein [Nostoc ellipsosporum NOK]